MEKQREAPGLYSRRSILTGSAMLLVGGIAGRISSAYGAPTPVAPAAPPLPWKWVKLDPMEAARRAYHAYHKEGG
ncbi:MAG TPA: hypothetical protein VEJ22_05855 [Nitrospirota bacterium]|nr:hypothetical protein [Nitrospirota bacterium]